MAVEVQAAPDEEELIANRSGADVEEAGRTFTDSLQHAEQAAVEVVKGFRERLTPDELTLTFGVKFGAKAGAILASADSEATFTLTAKWTRPAPSRKA